MKLMPAEELRKRQEDYINRVDDTQMQHIIAILNESYMKSERFRNFDKISDTNIGKLKLAGYTVRYFSDQREGSWYIVSW